jgi:FlaG/FlaF family flagellin (archaellin)
MGNMKANRKFVEGEDAVSAVIGVILMVAITVAIAATVYVYVSGMVTPESAGKVISALQMSADTTTHNATYKVTNADQGIAWSQVTVSNLGSPGTLISSVTGLAFTAGDNIDAGEYFSITVTTSGSYTYYLVAI